MSTSLFIRLVCAIAVLVLLSATNGDGAQAPPGVIITSKSKTHVHAIISDLPITDYSELTNIHALFTVYFKGDGATDEKLKALAQLRFTNLTCVVFTDCLRVTDKGMGHIAEMSMVTNVGLRHMAISDAACATMTSKMRLHGVNMPKCANVTVNGLLQMARSTTIASLGFSAGKMHQQDLVEIINAGGPKLVRMDIDLDGAVEERFDFPALRRAAEAKKVSLFAVRNMHVSKL